MFANSAARGFPPSPIPLLAAQALGMALAGAAGGAWRRWWLYGGRPRRTALLALPAIGLTLAAVFQAITNLVFAFLLTEAGSARWPVFWSGMAFGLIDMGVNALVFATAGPALASQLRRLARSRGWWTRAALVVTLVVCVAPREATGAQSPADSSSAAADSVWVPLESLGTPADSAAADSTEAAADSAAAPAPAEHGPRARVCPPGRCGRSLWFPRPLWTAYPGGDAAVEGLPGALGGLGGAESEISRVTTPASPVALDRWALGWNRVRLSYDGVPLNGPVHSFADPPDLPLAWRGTWRERASASGTAIDLGAPPPAEGDPVSQISLTSGSLGRRSDEFALFRNLGPVDVGVDFRDREELGIVDLDKVTANRVWFRVNSRAGRRPDWSLDLSMGSDKAVDFTGAVAQAFRAPRASVAARTVPGRRDALRIAGAPSGAERVPRIPPTTAKCIFDGITLQADWAASGVSGLIARARWDLDRRRRMLETDRTFNGLTAGLLWSGGWRAWRASAEAMAGDQEPWGGTATGAAALAWEKGPWRARIVASHDEDLPAMVLGVDRAILEYGLREHLEHFETAEFPESRSAIRAEGAWTRGRLGSHARRLDGAGAPPAARRESALDRGGEPLRSGDRAPRRRRRARRVRVAARGSRPRSLRRRRGSGPRSAAERGPVPRVVAGRGSGALAAEVVQGLARSRRLGGWARLRPAPQSRRRALRHHRARLRASGGPHRERHPHAGVPEPERLLHGVGLARVGHGHPACRAGAHVSARADACTSRSRL